MKMKHSKQKVGEKFEQLCEKYMIKKEVRSFYPRNFNLDKPFISALKRQYNILKDQGYNQQQIENKLTKAIRFHIKDFEEE